MQELKWWFRSFTRGTAGPMAFSQWGKEEREQLKKGVLAKRGRKWPCRVG